MVTVAWAASRAAGTLQPAHADADDYRSRDIFEDLPNDRSEMA